MEHRLTLIRVLTECVDRAEHAPMSLGDALDSLKTSAFGLSTAVPAVPAAADPGPVVQRRWPGADLARLATDAWP